MREVKEVNQLTEMDTAKSHKLKNDEVTIRTKGKSEKTCTLCTENRAPDRSMYTIRKSSIMSYVEFGTGR